MQGISKEIEESFSSCHVSFDKLEDHISFLCAPLLLGKKPLVTFVTEGINGKKIQHFFDKWPKGFFLVVFCKNNLPSLEKCTHVKKVPCYEMTSKESQLVFERYAQRKNLILDQEIMRFCAEHTKEGLWSEWITFLSIYPKEKINADLVSEYALLSLESAKEHLSETSFLEGLSFLKVNSIQRILLQSRWLKGCLASKSLAESKREIYPSVFFKDMPKVVALAQKKSFDTLSEKMERSLCFEVMMKKYKK